MSDIISWLSLSLFLPRKWELLPEPSSAARAILPWRTIWRLSSAAWSLALSSSRLKRLLAKSFWFTRLSPSSWARITLEASCASLRSSASDCLRARLVALRRSLLVRTVDECDLRRGVLSRARWRARSTFTDRSDSFLMAATHSLDRISSLWKDTVLPKRPLRMPRSAVSVDALVNALVLVATSALVAALVLVVASAVRGRRFGSAICLARAILPFNKACLFRWAFCWRATHLSKASLLAQAFSLSSLLKSTTTHCSSAALKAGSRFLF
mmetsp:Transcript_39133/g.83806  ORF Transcript_39133/g.83806 Transcript_39133/m.83806 type:complete len:269 (-) Transcript_39133:411-1217(-)